MRQVPIPSAGNRVFFDVETKRMQAGTVEGRAPILVGVGSVHQSGAADVVPNL
jgi:hypothetical protein